MVVNSSESTVALPSLDDLFSFIGKAGKPRPSKFPVNEPMIGLWCDAVGDGNPAYQDVTWAKASHWNGVIAPATTLNMWTLPGYRRIHDVGEPLDVVTQTLNSAGFTSVAAVQNDHTYVRPLRPGDRLAQIQHLGWMSDRKHTALGEGYFFDIVSDFVTQHDEHVGRATMRIFKWIPGSYETSSSSDGEPNACKVSDGWEADDAADKVTTRSSGITAGMTLPTWSIQLDTKRIIALAAATLDYNDVHFEKAAAIRAGAKDIYLNILGSSGLMNRYLTDWAGPETELKSMTLRLRNQCHPGDSVRFSGEVRSIIPAGSGRRAVVELDVVAANGRGTHQEATVSLETDVETR